MKDKSKRPNKRLNIYISGPMSGLPIEDIEYNFRIGLLEVGMMGFNPINPANICRMNLSYEEFMAIDEYILTQACEGIYMLRGWEDSEGAREELQIAKTMGLKIMYQAEEMNKVDEQR